MKELARQALVMVLEMNGELRGDPFRCLSHNHAQLNRVSVMTASEGTKTWAILSDRRRPRESFGEGRETKRVRINVLDGEESDEWRRPMKNGSELTVVPD